MMMSRLGQGNQEGKGKGKRREGGRGEEAGEGERGREEMLIVVAEDFGVGRCRYVQ